MEKDQLEIIQNEMNLNYLIEIIKKFENIEELDLKIAMKVIDLASNLLKHRKMLHKLLISLFQSRFPDLYSLISDYETYAFAAKFLSNRIDINSSDFINKLSQQQIVALNLSISNIGPPINNNFFFQVVDLQIYSSDISKKLGLIASNAVKRFAPNLCQLVGSDITSLLISTAGGLEELSKIVSCNLKSFGAKKIGLLGLSSRSTGNQYGVIYASELVQNSPPEIRDSVFRDLTNKVSLCSRIDSSFTYKNGEYGEKIKNSILEKIEKKLNNKTPKFIKPLPIPGLEIKKSRGGRQKRALKKKFGLTEELKQRQHLIFGIDEQFDDKGNQLGITALNKFRKKISNIDKSYQKKIEKKLNIKDKQ